MLTGIFLNVQGVEEGDATLHDGLGAGLAPGLE